LAKIFWRAITFISADGEEFADLQIRSLQNLLLAMPRNTL